MNRGIYTLSTASSMPVYGNIGTAIRRIILNKFPKDFFNYTNISTEIAYRNMYRQFNSRNNRSEISKRKKPALLINPIYQPQDRNAFLQSIPLTTNDMDIMYGVDVRALLPVIIDRDKGFRLKAKPNRDRIEFEITLEVSTLHQQIDIFKFMQNNITWEYMQQLNGVAIEAPIPKSIIYYLSKLCNIDVTESDDYIPIFLNYINKRTCYPITYKIKNSSGNDEYFLYYNHNIMIAFYDLEMDSGSMNNMAPDKYTISFRVSAEFNHFGLFVIDTDEFNTSLARDIKVPNLLQYGDTVEFAPLCTIHGFYDKYNVDYDGKQYFGSGIFTTELSPDGFTPEEYSVSFASVLGKEYSSIIRQYTSYIEKPVNMISILVAKNDDLIIEGDDFIVDYSTMSVRVKRPDNTATYRMIIYLNMELLNDTHIEKRDTSDVLDQNKLANNTLSPLSEKPFDIYHDVPVIVPDEPINYKENPDSEKKYSRIYKDPIIVDAWFPILGASELYNSIKGDLIDEKNIIKITL